MNNKEKLNILNRKLIEVEEKVRKLYSDKNILLNILNELSRKTNVKLNNLLYDIGLQEEISYLNDWVIFYEEKSVIYNNKIEALEEKISQQELEKIKKEAEAEKPVDLETKEMLDGKKPIEEIAKKTINKKLLIKYAVPFAFILLIITSLFLLKPAITGHVTLTKEIVYNEDLKLKINESGTYEWQVKNPGSIKSLKASGSIIGNGTVKVYIEKDGNKYLIYKNE